MNSSPSNMCPMPQKAVVTEVQAIAEEIPRTFGVDDPKQIKNANLTFVKAEPLSDSDGDKSSSDNEEMDSRIQ
eukprot:scaffold7970_cov118-Cylindrotheca_fusiformis.AAC.12